MSWQIRQDTNANRTTFTPDVGELFYATDTKRVWVGDGSTAGGVDPFATDPYGTVYDVKVYGAVGDGVTDDLAAIQAVIDAVELSGGGEVVFPSGDFKITSFMLVDSPNVTLRGKGASSRIIAATGSGDFALKISSAGVKVKDICFVGGVTSELVLANECISMLSGAENTEISGCLFTGTDASHGFNVQIRGHAGCNNPRITNNYFERVVGTNSGYGYGIQCASIHGGVISGNVGIQTTTQGRHHVYLSVDCADVVVEGNRFKGGTNAMITCYSSTVAGKRIAVTGNVLDGLGTGGGAGGMIEFIGPMENCICSGNAIHDADAYGIKLESGNVGECKNNAIVGNVITSPDNGGIYLRGAEYTNIVGNIIVDAGAGGGAIYLTSPGSTTTNGTTIVGNRVSGTTHTYAASLSAADIMVSGNNFATGTSGVYNVLDPTKRYIIGNMDAESPKVYTASANAAANDTTPTVGGLRFLYLPANTVATGITQLDNGTAEQLVTLVGTSDTNSSTIADSGNFKLSAAWTANVDDTLTLHSANGTTWRELSRSQN